MSPASDPADVSSDLAWLLDLEGRVITCNEAAAAALAMARQEVMGRNLAELFPDRGTITELVREASAKGAAGPVVAKVVARTGEGEGARACSLRALALGSGANDQLLVLGALAPVDEDALGGVRRAFEELRQRLERLGVHEVTAEQGLLLVNPEGRIEYASLRMEMLLGATPGSLVSLPLSALAERLRPAEPLPEEGKQAGRCELHTSGAPPRTLQHTVVALHDATGTPAAA